MFGALHGLESFSQMVERLDLGPGLALQSEGAEGLLPGQQRRLQHVGGEPLALQCSTASSPAWLRHVGHSTQAAPSAADQQLALWTWESGLALQEGSAEGLVPAQRRRLQQEVDSVPCWALVFCQAGEPVVHLSCCSSCRAAGGTADLLQYS